jgi:glycosyltransferase involved in cell wall biosynthesis
MRIAHFARYTPRRSGLYEATRDQILAERAAGLDSIFVDYEIRDPVKVTQSDPSADFCDEGLTVATWEEAKDCDVWTLHRGIPQELMPLFKQKRTIAVLHGTTEGLLLDDVASEGEKAGVNMHISILWDYDATVAVNEHDYRIMQLYDKNKTLHFVHDAIDVNRYSPEGYAMEFRGEPAILAADMVRPNKTPANLLWAIPHVRKLYPKARAEVFSLELGPIILWRNIVVRSPDSGLRGGIETIQLMGSDLRPAMRGADIGWNCNISGIPSRTAMETMACGTPVLSSTGVFTPIPSHPFDTSVIASSLCRLWEMIEKDQPAWREAARAYAVENFNVKLAVEQGFIPLYEKRAGSYTPKPFRGPNA